MTAVKHDKVPPWVMLPTKWIQDRGLHGFRWPRNGGSDHAAALMVLIVMAHHVDRTTGTGDLTYDQLSEFTSLSRAKVSEGLKILEQKKLVARKQDGRSSYALCDYNPREGWGKLPAQPLYSNGCVAFFSELKLRKPTELHALKLYLLFVERRDRNTNFANISYEKIEEYTGIDRNRIKSGLSLLAVNGMIHAEHPPAMANSLGVSSSYRLLHLDSRIHMGTRGRRNGDELSEGFESAA